MSALDASVMVRCDRQVQKIRGNARYTERCSTMVELKFGMMNRGGFLEIDYWVPLDSLDFNIGLDGALRSYGWTVSSGRHICPVHSSKQSWLPTLGVVRAP